jgi:2-C-methyl-D-erythritol 2,4-cyclodiphosphate synthase
MFKTGIGFDIHRLVHNRKLILAGVNIKHSYGLQGHSDADVVSHAIADAVLGALAAGDIGTHFPDTDPKWKGVTSLNLFSYILQIAEDKKARLIHIDSTIIAEAPKLQPYIPQMRKNLSSAMNIHYERVSVKCTTAEGLGIIGEHKAIAAMATATLEQ